MRRQELSPASVIDASPITSSHEYIFHRVRETHDIVHVLTSFSIDAAGELGIQGFILAQIRSPLAVFFIFGGILATLKNQLPLDKLLKSLARGFELGLQAQCVIACKLEDSWDRPLVDWQQELGLPVSQILEA
jgi:ubiquinone biosynthesis protein Coq4